MLLGSLACTGGKQLRLGSECGDEATTHSVKERRDGVRLFFQGTKHPHPGVPEMAIVGESRALASELGALDTSVFFNTSWVDYSERENYLTEADAGVSTHFSHIETTFSFRTRILDYLWAELPMVVTAGDHFAELSAAEKLGVVVEAGQRIAVLLGSANRDPVVFDEPDEFRVHRDPNNHVAFGVGVHFCLGAPLARMELAESLAALWSAFPSLQLAGEPESRGTFVLRGFHRVPVGGVP